LDIIKLSLYLSWVKIPIVNTQGVNSHPEENSNKQPSSCSYSCVFTSDKSNKCVLSTWGELFSRRLCPIWNNSLSADNLDIYHFPFPHTHTNVIIVYIYWTTNLSFSSITMVDLIYNFKDFQRNVCVVVL
jgi:hypothetical protein